ncbi:hypothetical protein GIB67_024396 [Kingdonia uniflora]|uniref:Bet v I/Major latex protein domain-containing protein n=1 Tax=Kingdonia uniflora TaxID=39325 RepID=A0A7J7LFF8_9MAGN|nr:hypothetical protein GIB67_024396 [Kingdonia uniflora]
MVVTSFTEEFKTPIPPARLFKALFLDSNLLLPRIRPQTFKSVEVIQGNGDVGTVTQINITEPDGSTTYVKRRIDALDRANYACTYTMFEGNSMGQTIGSVVYDIKIVLSGDGGSIVRIHSVYHNKGGVEIKEEEIRAAKDKAMETFRATEAYLIHSPDACT